jgi:AcrR family transcriptional regulator
VSTTQPARLDGHLQGRVPRAVRERQLLDVAEKLFKQHGYEGTSIEDVARAAGVTRPVVYEHHGDKDGLFVACVRRARLEFEQALIGGAAEAAGSDLNAMIRFGGELFFARLEQDPRRCALLLTTGSGPLGERLAQLRDATVVRVSAMLPEHAPGLPPNPEAREAAARMVIGVAEELARWWLRSPEIPRARMVEYFATFVATGLFGLMTVVEGTDTDEERQAG